MNTVRLETKSLRIGQISDHGYYPQWTFRMPPGIGRASQFAYSILALPHYTSYGSGDVPLKQLVHYQLPAWHPWMLRWQGMPIPHGDTRLTPLSMPNPMQSPNNYVYPGM